MRKDSWSKSDLDGPQTVALLINAIVFKGDWQNPFEKEQTKPLPFCVDKKQTKIPTMFQSGVFPYMRTDNFTAVELPYKGEDLSMVVIVPDQQFLKWEQSLTSENLGVIFDGLREGTTNAHIYLPKFQFESRHLLGGILKEKLRMKHTFEPDADFSRMTESAKNGSTNISKIIHHAVIARRWMANGHSRHPTLPF